MEILELNNKIAATIKTQQMDSTAEWHGQRRKKTISELKDGMKKITHSEQQRGN